MKRYKVWVECEKEIEEKNLNEAIKKFQKQKLELEFHGVELK